MDNGLQPLVGGTPAMTEAYDLKNLAARAKNVGLEVTEDGARKLVLEVAAWLKESAKLSPNKMDDVAVGAFLDTAVETVLQVVDKIDGQAG